MTKILFSRFMVARLSDADGCFSSVRREFFAQEFFARKGLMFLMRSAAKVAVTFAGVASLVCSLVWSAGAWAAGSYIYDAAGEVTAAVGKNSAKRVARNDAITQDTLFKTGDKSYAVLKFEDGQVVILQSNSTFQVRQYQYNPKQAEKSSAVFSMLKGGMRFVTGLIGQRNKSAFRLTTPNMTIGIRGTEFMVAQVNGAVYTQVISGGVSATNEAGTAEFTAGQNAVVASAKSSPAAIAAEDMPAGTFSQLAAIPVPSAVPSIPPVATPVVPSSGTSNGDNASKKAVVEAGEAADLFGKHNFTARGAAAGEICAFCHAPQGAETRVAAPLWNRSRPAVSDYQAYSTLGSTTAAATGSVSMACLSCHDGTQAPNVLINSNTGITEDLEVDSKTALISDGSSSMKSHHPVGMQYGGGGLDNAKPVAPLNLEDFRSATYSGIGSSTVWWIDRGGKGRQNTDILLYSRADTAGSESLSRPYVECASCHDPHKVSTPTFLRVANPQGSALCLTCHAK